MQRKFATYLAALTLVIVAWSGLFVVLLTIVSVVPA